MKVFWKIDIKLDQVTLDGHIIRRPDHISRSEWQRFWEYIRDRLNEV